jgi:hypothetical protein
MSQEDARLQPGTEEGQRTQPRCRSSGSPATEPSGPQVGPPRTTPSPAQLLTGPRGANGGQYRRLWALAPPIAQLVRSKPQQQAPSAKHLEQAPRGKHPVASSELVVASPSSSLGATTEPQKTERKQRGAGEGGHDVHAGPRPAAASSQQQPTTCTTHGPQGAALLAPRPTAAWALGSGLCGLIAIATSY